MSSLGQPTNGPLAVETGSTILGNDIGKLNFDRIPDYFKDFNGTIMKSGWENQNGYKSREGMGVVTFVRGMTYIYALQFYLPLIARLFPVKFTDKLECATVIFEVQPDIAKPTALRAPKTDLKGVRWRAFKGATRYYGGQATLIMNIADDGKIGEYETKLQLLAKVQGLQVATVIECLQTVLAIPNPYYATLLDKKNTTIENHISEIMRRECMLWDCLNNMDYGLQKIEPRSKKELKIQKGEADEWLVSESLASFICNRPDNVEFYRIGTNMTSGGRNKNDTTQKLAPVQGVPFTECPSFFIGTDVIWDPLERYIVKGEFIFGPHHRKEFNYESHEQMRHAVKLTDSVKKTLEIIQPIDAVKNCHLYKNGELIENKNLKQSDLFQRVSPDTKSSSINKYFFQYITENTIERFLNTCGESLWGYCRKYTGVSKEEDVKLWSEVIEICKKTSSFNEAQLKQFQKIVPANIYLNNTFTDGGIIPGFFRSIYGLRQYAQSTTVTEEVLSVKKWLSMMDRYMVALKSVFTTNTIFNDTDPLAKLLDNILFYGAVDVYYNGSLTNLKVTSDDLAMFKDLGIFNIDDTTIKEFKPFSMEYYIKDVLFQDLLLFDEKETSKDIKKGLKKLEDPIKQYNNNMSSLKYVSLLYLISENTQETLQNIVKSNIAEPFRLLYLRPMKRFHTETMFKVKAGLLAYRMMAFPGSKIGTSVESTNYKAFWEVAFGTQIGDPMSCSFFDNVLIKDHIAGDTTKWSTPSLSTGKTPEFFVVFADLGYEPPEDFIDISGFFSGKSPNSRNTIEGVSDHRIPNLERYNYIWGGTLIQNNYNAVMGPLFHRQFPLDIEDDIEDFPNNYLLTYETHMILGLENKWETVCRDGLWKTITPDFVQKRYHNKL